jgi:hypothetical protein
VPVRLYGWLEISIGKKYSQHSEKQVLTCCSWRWSKEKYVAIKVNAIGQPLRRAPPDNEIDILRHISKVNPEHAGWRFNRNLSDHFSLEGSLGTHRCLVMEALREPLWLYCKRYVGGVIPPAILKMQIQMILQGLDYLHSECKVIYTGKSRSWPKDGSN